MPYPKKLLNDFETVALDLHPHWWFFAKAVIALVASIAFGIIVIVMLDGTAQSVLGWVALEAIVFSVLFTVKRYLLWSTTIFVVTCAGVFSLSGVVAMRGFEIPLERVNTVHSSQSVFERLVGAGDLLIESAGESGQQRFTDVRKPDRVQNLIHSQREANQSRMFGGGQVVTDVPTQLEKLEGLLGRGTITPEEFEAQKRRLLGG